MGRMNKINVLIFTNSFRVGGSERQAFELAKRLNRNVFALHLVCFQKEGPLLDELPEADVKEIQSFSINGFLSWSAIRHAQRFISLLKTENIHVVQCFDFYTNVFAIPLARLAGVPIVLGARREEVVTKTTMQRAVQRWCYHLTTGVVANADAMKTQLVNNEQVPQSKIWVIHNGLDLERFQEGKHNRSVQRSNADGGITIGVLANLRPEKGHSVLLNAVRQLAGCGYDVRLLIAGNGPMKQSIEHGIATLSLSKRVQMVGAVKDVPAFLRTIDIAVLPSLSNEGFPNAVMEAMAASLPVIATDTGGTTELVVEGETGLIVQPGDVDELANAIAKLCRDSELRRKMGEAGYYRIIQHFTTERMVKQFEKLFISLAA